MLTVTFCTPEVCKYISLKLLLGPIYMLASKLHLLLFVLLACMCLVLLYLHMYNTNHVHVHSFVPLQEPFIWSVSIFVVLFSFYQVNVVLKVNLSYAIR